MNLTKGILMAFAPDGELPDQESLSQLEMCLRDERAVVGALMADHHVGYSMPIGGVVAYDGAISPSGVGYDIACGNKAVLTPLHAADIEGDLGQIMASVQAAVAFGVGRNNATPFDHALFDAHAGTLSELDRLGGDKLALSQKARAQLGTVGSGNHYVDLLADEQERVWIANHFGSRGLGHTIAKGFLNLAAGLPFDARSKEKEEPTVIPTDSDLGQFYLDAMHLAGDYAYAGRDYVIEQVLGILGTETLSSVHCHHNFAWHEDGLWVIRKGATPLSTDLAFIGGSMGDGAAIVRGKPHPSYPASVPVQDIGALASAPHGAGRTMSRRAAAGKITHVWSCKTRDCKTTLPKIKGGGARPLCPECGGNMGKQQSRDASTGLVDWPTVRRGLAERGIVVRGSGADEAPEVYKNLDAVLAAHSNIEVVHRLRTLGVVMAGDDTYDPYKD